jgi:hypothetical protein
VLPDSKLSDFEIPIQTYLREGVRRGLHSTPTAQRLRKWFSLPIPPTPPDVFVTYLFRGAPRFILNTSRVFHLTNILGGRFQWPVDGMKMQQDLVDALNKQALSWDPSELSGREYRGGLKKIEPRELSMLPIDLEVVGAFRRDRRPAPVESPSLFEGL